MSIFNPITWATSEIGDLTQNTINELDERYINTGENVYQQDINNLNLVHLYMSSSGSIYFNGDNTTQTTAYDPGFITNQINQIMNDNNFTKLNICDLSNNTLKSTIIQNLNDLKIENNVINGVIEFITTSGTKRTVRIDMFGNFTGINDMNSSKVKTNQIILNNSIYFTQSGVNLVFQNNNNYGEFQWKGSSGWTLAFNPPSGQFGGMNNIVSHVLETKYIKFRDPSTFQLTGSQIYQSGRDIIIDNAFIPGSFKLKHKTSENIENVLIINEFMNMSGINDIQMKGTLTLNNNSVVHKFENGVYVIDNKNNGSSIQIKNYDNTGVLRQIVMDQFMNMSGINDLYVQRIFFNNTLFYPSVISQKTRNLYSNAVNETSIEYNNGEFLFIPCSTGLSPYNVIIKNNDNVLVSQNKTQNVSNVLTLCAVSGYTAGIRITEQESQLYAPKVMTNLKFSDNTIQTTAMTESYLTNLIQNVVNQMNIMTVIPVGTILAYGGAFQYDSNGIIIPPAGYEYCYGQLVFISSYQNLYNAIQHQYASGQNIPAGSFYLPDLRGCTLKGTQWNPNFNTQTSILNVGNYQQNNVGFHSHKYTDRGTDTRNADTTGFTSFIKPSSGDYWTDGISYDSNTHVQLDADTRVNSIGVNYIIKY
jgi:microcystin-dependent protein